MKLLIDSDIVAFMACCGTEYTVYDFLPENATFRYKKELKQYVQFNYDDDDIAKIDWDIHCIPRTVTEPIKHTYRAFDAVLTTLIRQTDASEYCIVVKGLEKPNFRLSIPYPVVYKGTRPAKPSNYEAMMAYIRDQPCVVYAEGMEVDDLLGIMQDKETDTTVIATTDKDLLYGVPGLKFNIHHPEKGIFKTSEAEATRFFYLQMLMGDRVDNVIGIDGLGPKKSEKLLTPDMTPEQMAAIVREQYQKEWPDTWEDMYQANMRLLWILREPPSG